MNTSELTVRQAELDRLLNDQQYLHGLPMEQSNILRREKETLDAFLNASSQSQSAHIPAPGEANAVQGIAVAPFHPDKEPGNMAAGAAARAAQRVTEAAFAPQQGQAAPAPVQSVPEPNTAQQQPSQPQQQPKAKAAPVKKAVQKQAPVQKNAVSKKKK